jgi:predicted MFS family arabinose efflux permease
LELGGVMVAANQLETATSESQETEAPWRWYVLLILTLTYAANIADRFSISTFIEPIKQELGLSDSGVGFLTGVAIALFYVTVGIPLAVLADRSHRRNLLCASLALWSLMTACSGLARSYLTLLLSRIGVGVGEAGGTPASSALMADFFRPAQRPFAMSLFALGAPLGAWLGSSVAGSIAQDRGWRSAFVTFGIAGIVLSCVILLTIREPQRGRLDQGSISKPGSLGATLRFIAHRPALIHLLAGGSILTFWTWGLIWWTPAFMMRSHGFTLGEAGVVLGRMHFIGGIGALLFTTWLMSLRRMESPNAVLNFIAAATALATIPSFLVYASSSRLGMTLSLWVLIPATYFYIGPIMGLLQNLVPAGMRSQIMAILLFFANVANLVIAPQLIGFLSDRLYASTTLGHDSLRWVLACAAFSGFWAAWHVWRSSQLIRRDASGRYAPIIVGEPASA